jgi:protein-S-isoprenylcysteine O-methyltransferase
MTGGTRDPRRDRSIGWLLVGYAGLAGFLALEATTRRRGSASRLDETADDDGTTRAIVRAYALAGLATPIVRLLPGPLLPRSAAPAGVVLQALGLGLRAWSMETLGGAYSRTLRAEDEQRVIETGPYGLVRHPGYLGSLLVWAGFALTSRNLAVVAIAGVLLGDAYRRRIEAEERLLRRDLPDYVEYSERTKRLVPWIW